MKIELPYSRVVCETLIDLLQYYEQKQPDALLYEFLSDVEEKSSELMTYGELAKRARAIAVSIQKKGIKPRERAVLIYPPGSDLIAAYFGCLYAGVIAIPVYPPMNIKFLEKLYYVLSDAEPQIILSTAEITKKLHQLRLVRHLTRVPLVTHIFNRYWPLGSALSKSGLENFTWLSTNTLSYAEGLLWQKPDLLSEDIAFLQYTSGSTAQPKGVMVSHENLLHNMSLIHQAFGLKRDSKCVSWLPPYHDMGLIGAILTPLFGGFSCILMSPMRFLRNPASWLQTITDTHATISGGPNFAYDYCVNKITAKQKETLDLSHLEVVFNGAEPIHADTLERFYEAFKECGFNKSAFSPCYGLAEGTLLVSAKEYAKTYKELIVSKKKLKENKLELSESKNNETKTIISSGCPYQEVRIVNPKTHNLCDEGEIGEIYIASPSVTQGYWQNTEETKAVYGVVIKNEPSNHRRYLRTGDLGVFVDKNLYVTGRKKDLIVIHGENYYPSDIEFVVNHTHNLLLNRACAAFSIDVNNEEKLAIVSEVNFFEKSEKNEIYAELCQIILEAVAAAYEINVYSIALVKAKSLPKTTSGKIRRKYIKEQWELKQLALLYEWKINFKKNDLFKNFQTELETALCDLYSECFNQPINVTDRFLKVGGDSLLAIQLSSRIQENWGVEIGSDYFFKDPDIKELANDIKKMQKNIQRSTKYEGASLQLMPRNISIPLSYAQQRLWILDQLAPDNPYYNLPVIINLIGSLDIASLEKAISKIMQRHEILRTVIRVVDSEPQQIIQPLPSLSLSLKQMTEVDFEKMVQQESYRAFDLNQGPLIRYFLAEINEKKYRLLIVAHHIIADGWSVGIFAKELSILYNAYLDELPVSLPLPALQYADYSLWQHNPKHTAYLETQLDYWRMKLQDAPEQLNLPVDKPRPPISSYQGDQVNLVLSAELTLKLEQVSYKNKASLLMTLLAAFQILLSRYANQADIVVAIPTAQRSQKELEKLIGLFINTLAVREMVDENTNFYHFLGNVKKTMLDALAHEDVPFEQVVSALKISHSENSLPLCQVMFVLQQNLRQKLQMKGIETAVKTNSIMAKFDLTLECEKNNDQLVCIFEYATDIFNRSTIERMSEHWQILLESIVKSPELPINELSMLTGKEYEKLVLEWNNTRTDFQSKKTIYNLFEEQAEKYPNNTAVAHEDAKITYCQLNERSNQLANQLISSGAKPENIVAICIERSIDLIIALLGTLKSGCAYVLFDPNVFNSHHFYQVVEEANVNFLLLNNKNSNLCAQFKGKMITVMNENHSNYPKNNLDLLINENSLAYIAYTSGSTGKPKGALIEHKGLCNLAQWYKTNFNVTEHDRAAQYASCAFDTFGCELWPYLALGASVYIVSEEKKYNFALLMNWFEKEKITICDIPTALACSLWQENWSNNSSLRLFIVGGEKLAQLPNKKLPFDIWNSYGPTEATIECIMEKIYQKNGSIIDNNPAVIGKSIMNTQAYILNSTLKPSPVGVPGELYLGGVGIARGYLKQPDLTAQSFIDNPFGEGKLYKTGDICIRLENGKIVYLSRLDDQIKLRGYRIELGAIEFQLRKLVGVKEAVVLLREESDRNLKQLVAYWIPENKKDVPTDVMLKNHLGELLPDYFIPNAFIKLEKFPLTQNGKIDKKQLLKIESEKRNIVSNENQTETEKILTEIWKKELRLKSVNTDDNFFDLGGHSLLGIQILSKISSKLNINLTLSDLLKYQTIKELSDYLTRTVYVNNRKQETKTLVRLNSGWGKPLLFVFHPVGGNVFCYKKLAENLSEHYNVYGLQSPKLFSNETDYAKMEEMVSDYLIEISTLQAQGPFSFLGWSTGGLIAFEAAQQLAAEGYKIDLLALIDTYNPLIEPHISQMSNNDLLIYLFKMLIHGADNLGGYFPTWKLKLSFLFLENHLKLPQTAIISLFLTFIKTQGLHIDKTKIYDDILSIKSDFSFSVDTGFPIEQWVVFLKENGLINKEISNDEIQRYYNVFRVNMMLSESYSPSFYNGDILLFSSHLRRDSNNWTSYCKSVQQVIVRGNHFDILKKKKPLELISKNLIDWRKKWI